MSVHVRLVGPLRVGGEDGALAGRALGGARERRLLAILAAAGGDVVPSDVLIEHLWDRPPRDPAASLATSVSLLRRALGPLGPALETHRPGYRLAATTDLARVDGLAGARRWEEALALLDGELLEGEPPSQWLDERRRELARRRLDVTVEAAHAAAARGDDAAAHEWYAVAVRTDPLREDAQRGVMASLARLGRTAEALRAWEHCRRALREELGADPAPETAAVYERILAGRPPEPVRPDRAAVPGLALVGRRAELAWLTAEEGGALRVLLGEPGIGKSRLLQEAAARLAGRRVAATKCARLAAPVPYAVLAELAPGLVDDPGGEAPALGPRAGAVRLAARWATALAREPVTLVVDDLQWADEPSLVVLGLVLRRRPADLAVLAAARDAELAPDGAPAQLLALADGLGLLATLRLGPLPPEDLVGAGYDFEDWRRTGGHPLLLAEWLGGGRQADLSSVVVARAAAAGIDATELLRAAAVLDRPAPLAELAALADLSTAAAREAAGRLAGAGLLVEAGGLWSVRHDVVAELVRAELAPAARAGWHARALARLEAAGADPAELAHHAAAAGDRAASVRHSLVAGDRALAAFANREAVAHYQRVLEHLDAPGPELAGAERVGRSAALGAARALIVLARTDEARTVLARIPPAGGREEVERLLVEADGAWAAWKPSQAIGPARRALALARELGDEALEGRVHAFIANPLGSLGELDRSVEHVEAALAVARRLGRPPPAVVLYRLGIIEHQRGHEEVALGHLDRCRELALDQHDERTLVFERVVRAWALGALGRYGEALAALDDVGAIGRGEEAVVRGRVPNSRASLLFDLGLVEMALDADEESLELTRGHEVAVLEPQIHTLLNLATDHLHLGDPDRAAANLAEAERLSADAEYARFRYLNRLHWVRGRLCLEAGDVDGALAAAAQVEAMASQYRAPKYRVRAGLLRAEALAARPRERDAALAEVRAAARLAEGHRFAALAERAHRVAAGLASSTHHARQADRWRARIAASVEGPYRRYLG